MILTPRNWNSFQHYKDRAPAWIKLHRALLDDYAFFCLPVASRALAPCLWLLASEYEGGKINATLDELAFRLRMTRGELADALSPLVESGFFDASEPLAECEQEAIPEKRREEEEKISCPVAKATRTKNEYSEEFETKFWAPYPRSPTMSKKEAWREWMKLKPDERDAACKAIEPYRKHLRSKPTLETVHACRFLSQRRFEGFSEAPPMQPAFDIRSSIV